MICSMESDSNHRTFYWSAQYHFARQIESLWDCNYEGWGLELRAELFDVSSLLNHRTHNLQNVRMENSAVIDHKSDLYG